MITRTFRHLLVLAAALAVGLATHSYAQDAGNGGRGGDNGGRGGRGGGNWDPAAMQQRMMGYMKEQLGATDDEWKILEPRVAAVMEKQRAVRELGSRGGFGRGARPGATADAQQQSEVAALEKAIAADDATAIKAALEALRKARAEREAALDKAKEALREVLTAKQEARLVLNGTLD